MQGLRLEKLTFSETFRLFVFMVHTVSTLNHVDTSSLMLQVKWVGGSFSPLRM